MPGKTPPKPDQGPRQPGEQQRRGDQADRSTPPDTQNRPIEVPGRPDADRMTDRKPAYGPGGGQPQDEVHGTEASENPGAIDTPYPDDDMSGRRNAET